LFEPLFKERPNLQEWINEKIIPIEGDLALKGLGLNPELRQKLIKEVEIVLNNAASVNFMEPLRDALNINYLGPLRLLDLVHECEKIVCMVHVSSAYVNCNQKSDSLIPEKLLDLTVEPEEYISKLLAMNP
jgi:fatty acyl-CoA reductase